MKRIKLGTMFLVAVLLVGLVAVRAQSDKELQPKEVNQDVAPAQSKDKFDPAGTSEKSVSEVSHQLYEMVMDALGELAGEYEWNGDQIPQTSTDQPSATWISKSDNYMLEPGFVHASFMMPGEATADGAIDIAQVMHLINCLFIAGSKPCAIEEGDANCDGSVDVADVMFLVNYLFVHGSPVGR
jgi:hypothetical protein